MNATAPTEIDGRRARRDRNRDAVVDAVLDCFREGELRPSVADVAERSGVSLRSVFRYFDDLDEMRRAAIARYTEATGHLFDLAGIGRGSRAERIDGLIAHRSRLYDEVAPIVRVSVLRAPSQPVVAESLTKMRDRLRGQLDVHFEPELATLSKVEREMVLAALEVVTGFEAQERLRVLRGLPAQRCADVMRLSVDRLLPA